MKLENWILEFYKNNFNKKLNLDFKKFEKKNNYLRFKKLYNKREKIKFENWKIVIQI